MHPWHNLPPHKAAPPDEDVFSAVDTLKDADLKNRLAGLLKRQTQSPE
jgi:hypothetical protein